MAKMMKMPLRPKRDRVYRVRMRYGPLDEIWYVKAPTLSEAKAKFEAFMGAPPASWLTWSKAERVGRDGKLI